MIQPLHLFKHQPVERDEVTIEVYLDNLDPADRRTVERVIDIIHQSCPSVIMAIKYGVPYFSQSGPLAYLSPHKQGFYVGFVQGVLPQDPENQLIGLDRKQVRHFHIPDLESFDEGYLRFLIQQGAAFMLAVGIDYSW